jgi:peptide/nickel transport system permease protein
MYFIASRLVQGLAVIGTILVVVFFAIRVAGDPVDIILPLNASEETREELRRQLGLDQPLLVQFARFLEDMLKLDFGNSYVRRTPALPVVLERFENTVQLVGMSMAVAIILGLVVGVVAALRPGGLLDKASVALSLISVSVPQFWLGLVLILIFAVGLGVLPSSGTGSLSHTVLPVITLALPPAGRFAVISRQAISEELTKDYIRMDRARGLPNWRVIHHALRATSVSIMAVVGYEAIYTLAGHSVIVETVFAWPGIGALVTESLGQRDFVMIQAVVAFIGVFVVVLSLLLDLLYFAADPRTSMGEAGAKS